MGIFMNREKKWTILIIFGILILIAGILIIKNLNQASEGDAKMIGEWTTLYILPGCSHCENQLNLFGGNKKYLNIVDCSKTPEKCGLMKFPTWKVANRNESYYGTQSIKELKDIISKSTNLSISELEGSEPFPPIK